MSNRMDGEVTSNVEKGRSTQLRTQLFDVGMESGDVTVEGDVAYSIPWTERGVLDAPVTRAYLPQSMTRNQPWTLG